jgi:hypothetical protein
MISGHWNISSLPTRTSRWFGSPYWFLLTLILVSSDSRTDMLMSALGKSVRQLPPPPPNPEL